MDNERLQDKLLHAAQETQDLLDKHAQFWSFAEPEMRDKLFQAVLNNQYLVLGALCVLLRRVPLP